MSTVELLNHMGDDLTVVNAARVSFDKQHKVMDAEKDPKLINYLAREGHWTPFSHPIVSFRVTCPLFVAAQLKRHVVGASVNEVSRRYVDSEPTFEDLTWRHRPDASIKQGSAGELTPQMQARANKIARNVVRIALESYEALLDMDIAPEQARSVLPQTMHTSWWWTASLYFWANLCALRIHSHAQKETRAVAEAIENHVEPLFPVSWAALKRHMREKES